MKKAFALILAVLYIATSSGVVLNTHFCMGKKATTNCLCSKEESKNDCCKDEVKVVKLENAHKASVLTYDLSVPSAVLPVGFASIYLNNFPALTTHQPVAHGPPEVTSPGIYLLNCVFRI